MADTDPAPHVFNASMGARLEVLYASPQIVAQRRRFRELLDVRDGESGVDVGCGVGHLTCELAEDVGVNGRMTGVDASADMLAGAAARCARAVSTIASPCAKAMRSRSACQTPAPTSSSPWQTYSYVPDIVAAIAEAARVLRPGGRYGVLERDSGSLRLRLGRRRAHAPHLRRPLALRACPPAARAATACSPTPA